MDTTPKNKNGWEQWGHHILLELERLNDYYEKIRDDHTKLKDVLIERTTDLSDKINNIQAQQNSYGIGEIKQWIKTYDDESVLSNIRDLKEWKKDISEIVSVTQLEKLHNDVQRLKSFQLKATTIFLVVQAMMGILLGAFKFQIIPI